MAKTCNPIAAGLASERSVKLPEKRLNNLSPSGLLCFEEKPIEFWFRYLYDGPKPPFVQFRPMAFGSAFDGRVKEMLAERQPKVFNPKRFGLLSMVDKGFHGDMELKDICEKLAQAYVNGPPGAYLKKTKPVIMEGSPAIIEIGGVPVYGKVDVQTDEPRIVDFKVSGSCSQAYPVVGYQSGWYYDLKKARGRLGKEFWEEIGQHKNGFKSLTLTKPDWAMQLVTYDMLRTGSASLNRRSPIAVDQVTFHPNGRIAFTHLEEEISCAFKRDVVKRYQKCWKAVTSGTVIPQEFRGLPVAQLDLLRQTIIRS